MSKNPNSNFDPQNLLPYAVIVAATSGNPEAVNTVLNHYSGMMTSLSTRKLYDEYGNAYYGVDVDVYDRLYSRLLRAILDFKV